MWLGREQRGGGKLRATRQVFHTNQALLYIPRHRALRSPKYHRVYRRLQPRLLPRQSRADQDRASSHFRPRRLFLRQSRHPLQVGRDHSLLDRKKGAQWRLIFCSTDAAAGARYSTCHHLRLTMKETSTMPCYGYRGGDKALAGSPKLCLMADQRLDRLMCSSARTIPWHAW